MAQKLIKIGMPLNASIDKGFPFLSKRMVDMGGVGWRNGGVAAHAMPGLRSRRLVAVTTGPAVALPISLAKSDPPLRGMLATGPAVAKLPARSVGV